MSFINDQLKAYRTILKKEMAAAHWTQIPVWANLIGHIGGTDGKYPRSVPFGAAKNKTLRPTYKVIEVLTDFKHQGGWDMDIPVAYPLTGKPIYGDNQALGNEEKRKWAYQKAVINQVRKPILLTDGLMGEQALDPKLVMQLMNQAKDELIDYNVRWQGYAPYDALYRGYSENILSSQADGGFGHVFSQKSHPNFYAAGVGKAVWSDTPATYETNVGTALGSISTTSSYQFSTKVIENMVKLASDHKIIPAIVGNHKLYIIVINPSQAIQLRRDSDWKAAQVANTYKVGEMSKLFTGEIEGMYAGALVIVDQNNPGVLVNGDSGYDSTRGTVNYGNENPLETPIHSADKKLAVLVGASAIRGGHAKSLTFASESWDYENKKSESSITIVGYNRNDIIDNDGFFGTAGNFKENTSSLVVATYSPNAVSWS